MNEPAPDLAADVAEVLRAHDFDGPDAPYNPELLTFARAAERVAEELQRVTATPETTSDVIAINAAVRVELERDYARNLINSTDPDDLSPAKLAEYRKHVQKIVHAHNRANQVGPTDGKRAGLYGGVGA